MLFGGSFDPIHVGHVGVARSAAQQLAARVVLIPAAVPPHKRDRRLASAEHRLAMCRLAVTSEPQFEVSDWELHQPGPNYTLHTVAAFRISLPGDELYWLIGMDSLAELATWHRVAELVDACTIVTVRRPGQTLPNLDEQLGRVLSPAQRARLATHILETPAYDVSATRIRAAIRAGEDISAWVAPRVAEYIRRNGLYRQ